MSDPATVLDPGRAAHASIHGYLYQSYLGVERWLELKDDEILRCEGDEDLDRLLRGGSGGLSEQVKALTGDVNIRDEVVQDTLRRFLVSHHRLRTATEPDLRRFLFTSTAAQRPQKTDDRYSVDVLAVWEEAKTSKRTRGQVVKSLKKFLPFAKPAKKYKKQLEFWEQLQAALTWLDGDAERWADLIRSVEWRLGEPQLNEVRGKIAEALARLRPSAPPNLQHRLLAEVLDASIAREPRNRCRTREQLDVLLRQVEAEVSQWLASGGHKLVERIEELDFLRGILLDKHRPLPSPAGQGQLLTAAYEVIPFDKTGREAILKDLEGWCADPRKRRVRLIYGDGGLGKTRLLLECCRQLAARGWITGFLEKTATPDELARLLQGKLPRLVVIDYAETKLETVRFLVSRLAGVKDDPRVRLVLLARRAGDWLRDLKADMETEDLLESQSPGEGPLQLPELAEREAVFRKAVHAFALRLNKRLPEPLVIPRLTETEFGRPLYLHMAALGAVEGDPVTGAEEALAKTLERERRYWKTEIEARWKDPSDRRELFTGLERAVTVLTLLRGLPDEDRLTELAQRVLPPGAREATAQELALRLWDFYAATSGSGRHIEGLEPDLLGEELVWDVLRRRIQLLQIALDLADPEGRKQLLTVLTRLAQRPERTAEAEAWLKDAFEAKLDDLAEPALEVAVAQGDPVGTLLAEVIKERASLELARRIMNRCDGEDLWLSVHLQEVALHSTQRVYDQLQELREQSAAQTAPEETQAELAGLKSWLGIRLGELGRWEEALQATQDAVALYRLLIQQRPDAFRPDLAGSLNNLGRVLSTLGRREEALQATQDAVALYRLLSQQRPDAFRPDLASSLNNLGADLSDLGRREEALQATQESVEIRRLLAQQQPDAFRPNFASSLHNLGSRFSALGRREEALQATQEAVEIRRLLAQQRPDTFRPDLATSLNNLGNMLSDLGRREEALQATQEAADLYRLLAQQRPDAFRPDLAMSLNNLGGDLSALGRREEALQATQEAADLYRLLAQQRPDAFRPNLATSLNNLGIRLSDLGRREEALQATQEAVEIRRLLAQQRPDAFRPDLATSLNNLGLSLSALGRREEALQATQEAVDIRRFLAQQRPDAFSPDLAMSLGNLSVDLSDAGRLEEALAAAEEGVRMLAPFFLRYPRAFEVRMTSVVGSYRLSYEEADREPDPELLSPIEAALASLQEEPATEP